MIPRPVKSIASIYRSWKNRKGHYNLDVGGIRRTIQISWEQKKNRGTNIVE